MTPRSCWQVRMSRIGMDTEKISPGDYEQLKKFIVLYLDWFIPKAGKPEDHPLIFIADLEKKSLASAKRALQMAINDTVEMTSSWGSEQVAEADERFAAHGAFTLSHVRRRYSRKYHAILKRGLICTEAEYYLLKGILDGVDDVDAVDGRQIESLLTAFETKVLASVKNKQKK